MQNFRGFTSQAVENFAKKHGFASVDQNALIKIVLIIEVLVQNMLNNVMHIAKPLNVKLIKKAHFEAVVAVLVANKCQPTAAPAKGKKAQQGGHAGTVLPGEYFGHDSGRYFNDVSKFESSAFADGLARAPMEIKVTQNMMGGAAGQELVSKKTLKPLIAEYKKKNNYDFKVSNSAYEIMCASVIANITKLIKTAKGGSRGKKGALTLVDLHAAFKKHTAEFAHMSHVWRD